MIDFADCIVINKFDKPGAEDALLAVRKQYQRSHLEFESEAQTIPVFGVVANRFNDSGTNWFYHQLIETLIRKKSLNWTRSHQAEFAVSEMTELIPSERKEYLRQIATSVRNYKKEVRRKFNPCSGMRTTAWNNSANDKSLKPAELTEKQAETHNCRTVSDLLSLKLRKFRKIYVTLRNFITKNYTNFRQPFVIN